MRQPAHVVVYDREMRKVAYLENAHNISYELPLNALWRASFSLPATDEKNEECQPLYFVEIFDNNERIELFRIMPNTITRSRDGQTIQYECEHVMGTLIDDVMFQFHTVGGADHGTSQTIQYILSKQSTPRWQLDTCDFDYELEYTWESENLIKALYSIVTPFVEEYMWHFDTTVYPWKLMLKKPSEGAEAYIQYGKNMQGIKRYTDPTELCTRIYGLGYGEGINQLTIAEVNNGLPYLDADTQAQYGIISKVFVDRRYEHPQTLKAAMAAYLEHAKIPKVSYEVQASELFALTSDPMDKFRTGSQVRIVDKELGIDFTARVVKVSKGNMLLAPGEVTLEIANRIQNITTKTVEMSNRITVNETNAQGSTNVNVYNLAENCDPTHPAKFDLWIPEEAVRINKILLTYKSEPFRANSKAIEGGGAATVSSEAGDWDYSTQFTTGEPIGSPETEWGGDHRHRLEITGDGDHLHDVNGNLTSVNGKHYHELSFSDENEGHTHPIGDHRHFMFLIPHTHDVILPNHEHGIQFGIYEGTTASAVGILVDGKLVPGSSASGNNINLVDYLEKDEEGKIKRGQFHTIEIVPNRLSRIVATVVNQFFVQSRGGGSY